MKIPQFMMPILTLTGLGFFFALVLSWASRKFAVTQDPKLKEILETLPGSNCGACGMAGCANFGEALLHGEVGLTNCKVCSEEQAEKIGRILGVKVSLVKTVATLHCFGGKKAKDKFVYQGGRDCQSDAQLLGGHKLCVYACLGWGNCQRACPFDAIKMNEEGLPVIDSGLCTGCGKCVQACPRGLLLLIPRKSTVYVGCNSHDAAKGVVSACAVGCIACKKCEKVCEPGAIKVVDNLAVIDYDKCTSCGECVKACPRKIILRRNDK